LPTKISMYGRHVERDSRISSEPGRISYEMHPYAKAGSGISATIIDKDGFVLLGRKANSPIYILLGGYMKPYPLEGASGNELDSEGMDKIEEDLLLGKNNYSKMQPKTVKSTSYDFNLRATFNREIQEEAGITGNELARAKIFTVSISSDYGITNDPRLHTIVENICAYFKGERPNVKPGSDIAELIWVHTSQISKNTNLLPQQSISKESRYSFIKDGKVQYISDHCGEIIERATEQVNELKQKGYFTTKVTNEKKSIS
jgi:8-oxo-dGTP pyrophosphatase MutT (NUDIX family)